MAAKKAVHSGEEARRELSEVIGCLSCGMPTKRSGREAASDIAQLCPHCVDGSGHLKSYADVFERLVTQHFMAKEGMSRPEAEKAARQRMSELPAWKDAKA